MLVPIRKLMDNTNKTAKSVLCSDWKHHRALVPFQGPSFLPQVHAYFLKTRIDHFITPRGHPGYGQPWEG